MHICLKALAAFLLPLSLNAQTWHAQPVGKGFDPEALKDLPVIVAPAPSNSGMVPSKKDREKFFARFPAATPHMQGWDELSRDLFWFHLRERELPELKQRYSKFPEKTLKELKRAAAP